MANTTKQHADESTAISPHLAVRQELLRRLGRQWRTGDRLPPIKELARQLGAGQSSTQRAVRHLANQGLLKSRQRQGTIVLGTPDIPMEVESVGTRFDLSNRTVRLFSIGPGVDGFVQRMISSFESTLKPTNARIERQWIAEGTGPLQLDESPDSFVLFNLNGYEPIYRANQHLTIVTTAMRLALPSDGTYDLVGIDEYHGGALAGKALAKSGCKNICFLGRVLAPGFSRFDATSTIRLYGFEAGWGRPLTDQQMLFSQTYNPVSVGEMFQQYLDLNPRPDGIFAASDDLAVGFVGAAAAHGLRAGRDYQIVGFDGQDRGQTMGGASLTTVTVPAEEMGRRAAILMIERFAQPERPTHRLQLDCTLQIGTTTHPSISQENAT